MSGTDTPREARKAREISE